MKTKEREKLFFLVKRSKVSFLKKSFVTAILVISVLAMFTAAAVAGVDDPPCTCGDICVNETGWWRADADFYASNMPIQHAIDNATEGNTICVKDGTYNENVDVNKRLTIRSENGSASTIVNAADSIDHVFDVRMDYVNIRGFTVTGATKGGHAGICLYNDHCNISDNKATNNCHGILLESGNNKLTSNTASHNSYGIELKYSSYNTLTSNTASHNSYGILLEVSSNYNTLMSNTASNNSHGIYLEHSSNNELTSNTASNNSYGIYLEGNSNYNTLTSNTANSNNKCGIYLYYPSNNTLTSNTANSNDCGIELEHSSNNLIYNNYFHNTHNAYDHHGNNRWNITKTAGTNIIGGPYLGGNYWSDYAGTDTDGDGLGDTLLPYNSKGDIIGGGDYHPLVRVSGEELPVHNLNTGENFSTIQAAIDAVNTTDGQTITVDPGIYNENVDVYKSLTIKSTSGNPDDTIVQANNPDNHVFAVSMDYVNISGFTVKGATACLIGVPGYAGIYLDNVDHCNISHNNVSDNCHGIGLESSSSNTITDNNASYNMQGISLDYSSSNTIANNNANNSRMGIILQYSSSNILTGNNASYNLFVGMFLVNCGNNTLRNNLMSGNGGNFGARGRSYSELNNDIDISNLVDGKPIYYLVNASDTVIDPSSNAGTVYCINCDNVTVKDLTLAGNPTGIYLYNTSSSRIKNNSLTSSGLIGAMSCIHILNSSNNIITGNNARGSIGVQLVFSIGNTITDNDLQDSLTNNIIIWGSDNNTITGNNVSSGASNGIWITRSSNNNTITSNIASHTTFFHGICLNRGSNNNTITGNTASNNGKNGINLEDSDNNIITNNTACNNVCEGILIVSSNNNVITNNNASNNSDGIFIDCSNSNILTNNIFSSNNYGISLYSGNNNTFRNNTASNNDNYGIILESSSNNSIYNNYFNNTNNARDDGNNIWNITKTLGTNIIGGPYLGGNYWSDYAGKDLDGDGLGDTLLPYNSSGSIQNGGDYLPLVPVQKPTVSITTDKSIYKTGDTITISIDIYNPTENIVTFEWYWGVPQSDIWLLVTSVPIPAGYNDTINISFSIPNRGSTPSGSVFYVQLLDGSGEVLDADVTWWTYSPGRFMEAMSVDLSKEIEKIIEKVELPM